jgi:hypothetical protein
MLLDWPTLFLLAFTELWKGAIDGLSYDLTSGTRLRFSWVSIIPPIEDIYTGIYFDMLVFPILKLGFEKGVKSFGFLLCNAD